MRPLATLLSQRGPETQYLIQCDVPSSFSESLLGVWRSCRIKYNRNLIEYASTLGIDATSWSGIQLSFSFEIQVFIGSHFLKARLDTRCPNQLGVASPAVQLCRFLVYQSGSISSVN